MATTQNGKGAGRRADGVGAGGEAVGDYVGGGAKAAEADGLEYALQTCPAARCVRVIGGRWKLILLYHLSFGVLRYSDLQRHLPGITPKMLTQQLRELEEDGIVHREVYRQV